MRRLERENKGEAQNTRSLLIVILLVVSVGIAVAIGIAFFLGQVYFTEMKKPDLDHITIEVTEMTVGKTYEFNITAYDTNGVPLKGVEIHIQGYEIDIIKLTDSNGKAEFLVTPTLPENVTTGKITVTAKYTGTTPKNIEGFISVKKPDLDHITVEPTELAVGYTYEVVVVAYDTNAKPLAGVEISLEGCGINLKKLTDESGQARFSVTPTLPTNVHTGEIMVTAKYMGSFYKVYQTLIVVHD